MLQSEELETDRLLSCQILNFQACPHISKRDGTCQSVARISSMRLRELRMAHSTQPGLIICHMKHIPKEAKPQKLFPTRSSTANMACARSGVRKVALARTIWCRCLKPPTLVIRRFRTARLTVRHSLLGLILTGGQQPLAAKAVWGSAEGRSVSRWGRRRVRDYAVRLVTR